MSSPLYNDDGSINATLTTDEVTFIGLYNDDGSLNIVDKTSSTSSPVGLYNTNGGLNVTIVTSPFTGSAYADNGSRNVIASTEEFVGGAWKLTIIGAGPSIPDKNIVLRDGSNVIDRTSAYVITR